MSSVTVSTNDWAREQWGNFVESFNNGRFFMNDEQEVFKLVNALLQTPFQLDKNKCYYRARINEKKGELYTDDQMAAAPVDKVGNGRLNPKGIRHLYVAEHEYTAMAEVRPWINSDVTIAECKTKKDLYVIDFVPKSEERNKIHSFRVILSEEFSKPVNPNMTDTDYLPTQCIAEYIKSKGFDGIRYSSAVDPDGINYCLFDPESMIVKAERIREIKSVRYE